MATVALWTPGAGAAASGQDGLPDDQAAAARIIAAEMSRSASPELLELTRHPQADVRARAALALGRVGLPRQLPRLVDLTRDPLPQVRRAAVLGLGLLEYELDLAVETASRDRASEAALRLLQDSEAGVSAAAAWAIGAIGGRSTEMELWFRQSMADAHAETVAGAVSAWARLEPGRVDPVSGLVDSPDAVVRLAVARALAGSSDPARAPSLAALLDDPEADVRVVALQGLRFAPARVAARHVDGFLRFGDWREQAAMLDWLAAAWRREPDEPTDDDTFTMVLRRSLDRNLRVRRAALRALAQRPRRAVSVDRLLEALAEPDAAVRATAMRAVAGMDRSIAAEALSRLGALSADPSAADVERAQRLVLEARAGVLEAKQIAAIVADAGSLEALAALDELERVDPDAAWAASRRALSSPDPLVRRSAPARLSRLAALQEDPLQRVAAGDELWAVLRDDEDVRVQAAVLATLERVAPGLLSRRQSLLPDLLDPTLRRQAFLLLANDPERGGTVREAAERWFSDSLPDPSDAASLARRILALQAAPPVVLLASPRGDALVELSVATAPLATLRMLDRLSDGARELMVLADADPTATTLAFPEGIASHEWLPSPAEGDSLVVMDLRRVAADVSAVGDVGFVAVSPNGPPRVAMMGRVVAGLRMFGKLQPGDLVTLSLMEAQ